MRIRSLSPTTNLLLLPLLPKKPMMPSQPLLLMMMTKTIQKKLLQQMLQKILLQHLLLKLLLCYHSQDMEQETNNLLMWRGRRVRKQRQPTWRGAKPELQTRLLI
jgi:hypothetical protein